MFISVSTLVSVFRINRRGNGINRLYTCIYSRGLLYPITRSRSRRRWFQPSHTYTSPSPRPGSYHPPARPTSVIPRNPQLPTLATSCWSSFSCTYASIPATIAAKAEFSHFAYQWNEQSVIDFYDKFKGQEGETRW